MDAIGEENGQIGSEIDMMKSEITKLEEQIVEAKRTGQLGELYDLMDPEKTGTLTMKPVIVKLSGFAKFEVDHKFNKQQFCTMMKTITGWEDSWSDEKCEELNSAFTKAFKDGAAPFAGDLENELYKKIADTFKAFDPNAE